MFLVLKMGIGKPSESLRRVWVVIHGPEVPEGEKQNAEGIAEYLRNKLNIVRVLPADAQALDLLARFCNFVVVGGPLANECAFNLNNYVQPRYQIEVTREKTADESWGDYVRSGAVKVPGFLKDDVPYAGRPGVGLIGKGSQPYPRARPLQIIFVSGMDYGDTCTMGKAFRENANKGLYSCTYPPITYADPCPPDEAKSYSLITDP